MSDNLLKTESIITINISKIPFIIIGQQTKYMYSSNIKSAVKYPHNLIPYFERKK